MSETKFTKRQWDVCTKPKSENYALHVNCGDMMELTVITTAGDISHADGIERKANAHLIAAAPEMYNLLQDVMNSKCCTSEFSDQISELLAKARGEK